MATPDSDAVGVLTEIIESLPAVGETLSSSAESWRPVATGDDRADDITALVIGGGRFGAGDMDRFPRLRLLVRAGIGVDLIDLNEATRRDILVVNTPGYGTQEVADQALLLMLSAVRRLHHFERQADRNWLEVSYSGVRRLAGSTLGIIGLGAIGQAFANRVQSLGMTVVAYDPLLDSDVFTRVGVERHSLETLLSSSDVISLHAPLTGETRHILDHQAFAHVHRRPVIINTARGGLINSSDLIEALDTEVVAAAGLDVIESEPYAPSSLLEREDVIVTPHVAWYSEGARAEMGRLAATAAIDFLQTGSAPTALNPQASREGSV